MQEAEQAAAAVDDDAGVANDAGYVLADSAVCRHWSRQPGAEFTNIISSGWSNCSDPYHPVLLDSASTTQSSALFFYMLVK